MGWLHLSSCGSRKDIKEYLIKSNEDRIIDYGGSGNHFYMLVHANQSSEKIIVLCLLSSNDGWWGYKDISEDMGPAYYDCPVRLLKMSTCKAYHAVKWREACFAYRKRMNENRKNFKKCAGGFTIFYRATTFVNGVTQCIPCTFLRMLSAGQYVFRYSYYAGVENRGPFRAPVSDNLLFFEQ